MPALMVFSPRLRRTPSEVARITCAAALLAVSTFAQTHTPVVARLTDVPADPRITDADALRAQLASGALQLDVIVGLRPTRETESFVDWDDVRRAAEFRRKVERYEASVLASLPASEFTLRHRLENAPFFSGQVSLDGLAILLANSDVAVVEPDREKAMQMDEALGLIHGTTVRNEFGGAGVSIAICDTGVDYNHPALGGGGFPNARVIGGYDLADNDTNPMDLQGHGTSVAAIAAGLSLANGSFGGGVAPQARLYALKITPGAGSGAFDSTIVAAWDWCVTHKNDDPARPIVVINTSFGGGLYSGSCTGPTSSYFAAASNAVSAGISVFCSSGNDGACSQISAPACVDNTFAVGAAYDADLGQRSACVVPSSCVAVASSCTTGVECIDVNAIADQVTCFSNSSLWVDLLAPGDSIRTAQRGGGYRQFTGTSAAAPFAAGAAAVLVGKARGFGLSLPPMEVLHYLQVSGRPRLDLKSGILSPRLDLGAAIVLVGVWVNFGHTGGENGSLDFPFNTITEGILASPGTGSPLLITAGSTLEVPSFTKSVTLLAYGGNVLIGG